MSLSARNHWVQPESLAQNPKEAAGPHRVGRKLSITRGSSTNVPQRLRAFVRAQSVLSLRV